MNRREFLKSLLAIGTSLAINPTALAKATEADIDMAWRTLSNEPSIFYVNSWGALSSNFGVDYPTTRIELFGLELPPKDHAAFLDYVESDRTISDRVAFIYECADMDGTAGSAESWQDWITDEDALWDVRHQLECWLESHPDENDWERADLTGLTGRGDALQFFRLEQEIADTFGIVIVEGDHPGSSYFAAELRMEISEANQLAEELDIPIRFDQDEE